MCTNNALRPVSRWRIVASWIPSTSGCRKTVVVTSVIFTAIPCTFTAPKRATSSARHTLGEAEPVAGIVAEDGLDAVGALDRFLQKCNAIGLESLVRAPAVVRLEDAATECSLRYQCLDSLGVVRREHRWRRHREQDGHVGLVARADGQPPEAIQRHIAAHVEA